MFVEIIDGVIEGEEYELRSVVWSEAAGDPSSTKAVREGTVSFTMFHSGISWIRGQSDSLMTFHHQETQH